MESTETLPTSTRRPWVVVVVMAFLGYAAFVSLPMLVLGSQGGQWLTRVQVALSFATFLALWLAARRRLTFHLARLTLALWAARGIYAACRIAFGAAPLPQPPLIRVLMVLGAGALCSLFWLYGFGRRSRAFYGRRKAEGRRMKAEKKS